MPPSQNKLSAEVTLLVILHRTNEHMWATSLLMLDPNTHWKFGIWISRKVKRPPIIYLSLFSIYSFFSFTIPILPVLLSSAE